MRKFILLVSALLLSISLVSVAPATAHTEKAETGSNGFALGGIPDYWDICIANGYGPTAGVINNWNWQGHRLAVHLLNRCTGYSITNRMTIDNYAVTNAPCITYGNTHTTYSPSRGKNIFDQNVIVYVNTAAPCFDSNIELYHNLQRGVGYVLGLSMNPNVCHCVMGATQDDINNIPYVINADAQDMAVDYDN